MRQPRNRIVMAGLLCLVAIITFIAGIAFTSLRASAQSQQSDSHHAQKVVDTFLSILDTDMSSPQCDFSGLSTIYAPDATITATGGPFSPGGPFGPGGSFGQQHFQGISAITGFYTKLCHILYSKNAGAPSWTQDHAFVLAPNVLNSYEHVSLGGQLAGRCVHVFTIADDKIASLDWSVYA
ncbi:MAG: hypothetical protein ACRDHP_02250 [Ktedonobacterales bacterium]